MLDDEATDLLRRHLRSRFAPGCVLVERADLEFEIGEVRARDLDTWVEVNGGWLVPPLTTRGPGALYAVPRGLFDTEDSPPGEEPVNSA
jgi:hypothetical protein